jgi:Mg2+-importing ATPase
MLHPSSLAGLEQYWSLPAAEVASRLACDANGLSSREAADRLKTFGPNTLRHDRKRPRIRVLLNQLRSPLLLLLVFAASASLATGEWLDASIVVTIVLATVLIGYAREYSAETAVDALRSRIHTRVQTLRDGRFQPVDVRAIVPGDVVALSAGSLVPGDGVLLEASDLFVSQAVLTGESFPVEKRPGMAAATATLTERTNCVLLGTNVRSGTARCLIVQTGASTHFGSIAHRLDLEPPEAEFDRGIRRFGYLLMVTMFVMVLLVFVGNILSARPPVETLLFSIALAVGLSPELLPAILSVNLARAAQTMARQGVLVRRLNAIENLGSMNVLCTDKTGTLTEGVVRLDGSFDYRGRPSPEVLELGGCNAALETGLHNPLDDAILDACHTDFSSVGKAGEIPFDFVRKRVTVIIRRGDGFRLVTKGAFRQVLAVCTRAGDGSPLDAGQRAGLEQQHEAWSRSGIRVVAVATRDHAQAPADARVLESDMTFEGFLTFLDRPKPGVEQDIARLATMGISVKLITGDNKLVAQHVAGLVGLSTEHTLTGRDLDELNDEALWRVAEQTDLFVEVDPNQKERIILSLKKMGNVVGFLGDGVNDAPAMHAADTSLSVEEAVDVAREAADFVLLERGLDVIRRGVEEGRRTFANTLKYILITTSANLGNMMSMAVASLVLPFLPLLAGQILLNNFLSDIPAVGLADDDVDPELVDRPRRFNIAFIGRFMVTFGLISTAFDFLTFGALRVVFLAGPEEFRTGWFVESLLTELVIALVVRTRRPFYRSRPGTLLLASTAALVIVAFAFPYLPYVGLIGFVPLPAPLLASVGGITIGYVAVTELAKRRFYASAGSAELSTPRTRS